MDARCWRCRRFPPQRDHDPFDRRRHIFWPAPKQCQKPIGAHLLCDEKEGWIRLERKGHKSVWHPDSRVPYSPFAHGLVVATPEHHYSCSLRTVNRHRVQIFVQSCVVGHLAPRPSEGGSAYALKHHCRFWVWEKITGARMVYAPLRMS